MKSLHSSVEVSRCLKRLYIFGKTENGLDRGMDTKSVEHLLAWYLNWDIDMTFEEYTELLYKILETQYGEGWKDVLNVLNMYEEMDTGAC